MNASLPSSARDPQEFDEAMAKASNEMLARWVLKNMGNRRDDNVQFLAAIFAEHRRQCTQSETPTSIVATYQAKIERDATTIKTWRGLCAEAYAFLNAQVVLPEDYELWEKRYRAFRDEQAKIAAGVAFVTDERVGGP